MAQKLEVSSAHLGGELVRVEFSGSHLISDHPVSLGGAGKGPTPAALMLAAIATESALSGRAYASRNGLKVNHVGARMSQRIDQEGFAGELNAGPLPAKSFIGAMWRLLEIDGEISATQFEDMIDAMANTAIAKAVRQGIALDERLVCTATDGPPRLSSDQSAEKNAFHLTQDRLPEGEARTLLGADSWRLSVSAIDDQTCVVDFGHACLIIAASLEARRGPTPMELLLGALSSCTAIFVGRNAALLDIPVESVKVTVRAEIPEEPSQPITRLEKVCEITGNLSDDQVAQLSHCAEYCAIGVTLLRGTEIFDDYALEPVTGATYAAPLAGLGRKPAPPSEAACIDQSCCAPVTVAQGAASA